MGSRYCKVVGVEKHEDVPSGCFGYIAEVSVEQGSERFNRKVVIVIDCLEVAKWLAPRALKSKRGMTRVQQGVIQARVFRDAQARREGRGQK